MRCPCCGQLFEGIKLKMSLEYNTAFAGDRCVTMPPTPAEIVFAILQVAPAPLNKQRLFQRVFPQSRARDLDGQTRTQIYLARRYLEKIGYTIKHESDRGYRIVKL